MAENDIMDNVGKAVSGAINWVGNAAGNLWKTMQENKVFEKAMESASKFFSWAADGALKLFNGVTSAFSGKKDKPAEVATNQPVGNSAKVQPSSQDITMVTPTEGVPLNTQPAKIQR